jgi:uncharacterized repeat protein (TIGR02543 family)
MVVALAAVLAGAATTLGGGTAPTLGTSCGALRCSTFTVALGGNGTGVLAVVTLSGALTGTIECHRAGGTTSGICAYSYPTGATINFKVVAAAGSKTTCKVIGCDVSLSIKHFTLSGNMTLSSYGFALLDPVTIAVSVTGSGSGTVTSKPVGISCGGGKAACSVAFAAGSGVTLTAAAASGSTFKGWTGGCNGTQATCSIDVTTGTPLSLGAQFALIVTATPTPKPTATHGPTPRPTSQPTGQPVKTSTPGRTASPGGTQPGATIAPSASLGGAASAQPSAEESPAAGSVATASPSLAPLDTPIAGSGQAASSPGSVSSLLVFGLVVLLIVFAGGAFVFRRPRTRT